MLRAGGPRSQKILKQKKRAPTLTRSAYFYRYAQRMLKLTTFPINDAVGIAIRRNSHLLLSSTEVEEVAQRLADLVLKIRCHW